MIHGFHGIGAFGRSLTLAAALLSGGVGGLQPATAQTQPTAPVWHNEGQRPLQVVPPRLPDPVPQPMITGTITHPEPIILPPYAILELSLRDISDPSVFSLSVALETQTVGRQQFPIPFELPYDPAQIDANRTYIVRAAILVNGRQQFVSEQDYPVLTQGHPTELEIVVRSPR